MTAQLTHSQAISRLAELKAMFLEILSETIRKRIWKDGYRQTVFVPIYEIETHLSIEEWIDELCAREPQWEQDWNDIYLQLTGENVEPWRELKRLVETIPNL